MVQLCPRCRRANPGDAVFCHFDGCLLQQGAAGASGPVFLHEFVFPSGRRCRNFDDLVQGCYDEWEDARALLHDGTFAGFLAGLGRADLMRAAREAQALADRDIALTNFIASLPATQAQGPKLGLSPRRLVVGPLHVGEQRPVQLRVSNEGKGIVQGRLSVEGGSWLKLTGSPDDQALALHTPREQTVTLRVDTAGLVVGQNYAGKLVLVTNGGVAEVPVRLDLAAHPFSRAPYQGANSPHELARKMRDNPHPAVALLETGEVARWFVSNGWTYPIAGAPAPGLAAVQQFFEELGLARAPQIQVSDQELQFTCRPPETLDAQLAIRSPARKLVYGRVESNSSWLKVKTPDVSGQALATIGLVIDSAQLPGDGTHQGTLEIVANAGQKFQVRVVVQAQGGKYPSRSSRVHAPPSPAPAVPAPLPTWHAPGTTAPPAVAPPLPSGGSVSLGRTLLVGALLGLIVRLIMVLPADFYARLIGGPRSPVPGSLAAWLVVPVEDEGFLRLLALASWWGGAFLGGFLAWRGGGRLTDVLCGLLAGAVAGVGVAATLGCVVVLGDSLPRGLLRTLLGGSALGPGLATPLWMLTTLVCWTALGAMLGLGLALFGRGGRALLGRLTSPFVGVARSCGMSGLASLLELRAN